MIDSALIWYALFSATISDLGLKLDPYEWFISNKVIYEHQCTIGRFVDDNKFSHIVDNVTSMIAENIEEKNGKLSCTRRKKHAFLGKDIEFFGRKKVAVYIPNHIDEALRVFLDPESKHGETLNLATLHHHQWSKVAWSWKKGALSLDNHQNLVDHESFTARFGNSGVFSMHKVEVPNRVRLRET